MEGIAQRKEYWEQPGQVTNFDPHLEELSTKEILKLIPDGLKVADIGCGNGHPIIEAALANPNGRFHGFDASGAMIAEATKLNTASNLEFKIVDIAETLMHPLMAFETRFDIVLSRRLLINLNYGEKIRVLDNIIKMLNPHGKYIMCECWQEPLDRINAMRKVLGAEAIPVRPVNEYLTQDFARELWARFTPLSIAPRTYGSLYYIISRVFNARGDYNDPINLKAIRLVESGFDPLTAEYGYCPESIWILKPRR